MDLNIAPERDVVVSTVKMRLQYQRHVRTLAREAGMTVLAYAHRAVIKHLPALERNPPHGVGDLRRGMGKTATINFHLPAALMQRVRIVARRTQAAEKNGVIQTASARAILRTCLLAEAGPVEDDTVVLPCPPQMRPGKRVDSVLFLVSLTPKVYAYLARHPTHNVSVLIRDSITAHIEQVAQDPDVTYLSAPSMGGDVMRNVQVRMPRVMRDRLHAVAKAKDAKAATIARVCVARAVLGMLRASQSSQAQPEPATAA